MKEKTQSVEVLYEEQAQRSPAHSNTASSVALGTIQDFDGQGYPLIHWPECLNKHPVRALTQIKLTDYDIGRTCTLSFVNADMTQPVVMGLLYEPDTENDAPVILQSDDAIVLQSGRSRIELHANGRIHIQGMHISSQAYGPNQLKGGSVKIN